MSENPNCAGSGNVLTPLLSPPLSRLLSARQLIGQEGPIFDFAAPRLPIQHQRHTRWLPTPSSPPTSSPDTPLQNDDWRPGIEYDTYTGRE